MSVGTLNAELPYWLAFDRLTGISLGSRRVNILFESFGSLKQAWNAPRKDLLAVTEIPDTVLLRFLAFRKQVSLEEPLELLDKTGTKAILRIAPDYPTDLLKLDNPPLVIYVRGIWQPTWLSRSIAIVGTRQASEYALSQTSLLASQLVDCGFTVVSGVARGIDSAAHKGAYSSSNARCVAVVANGPDLIVPASSRSVYELLERYGTIISEYPPTTQPEKGFFPARNRIIAAISGSVLVAEAALKSGALITAERALELSKQVFCLAGRSDNPLAEGNHNWIRRGLGKLVCNVQDILNELQIPGILMSDQSSNQIDSSSKIIESSGTAMLNSSVESLSVKSTIKLKDAIVHQPVKSNFETMDQSSDLKDEERILYGALPCDGAAISFDEIVETTKLPMFKVNSLVVKLQIKGLLRRHANGRIGRA